MYVYVLWPTVRGVLLFRSRSVLMSMTLVMTRFEILDGARVLDLARGFVEVFAVDNTLDTGDVCSFSTGAG